jgi:hypothetical protein
MGYEELIYVRRDYLEASMELEDTLAVFAYIIHSVIFLLS